MTPPVPAFNAIVAAFASNAVEAAFPTVIARAVALVPMLIAPVFASVPIPIVLPLESIVNAPAACKSIVVTAVALNAAVGVNDTLPELSSVIFASVV